MVLVDNKWNTDDYNYCEEHQMYYHKYCFCCTLKIQEEKSVLRDTKLDKNFNQ